MSIYLLSIPTRLASILSQAPSLLLGLVLSLVDGMLRGTAVSSMPALAEASPSTHGSWLAPALLGAVATCGGGWIAQTLGLAQDTWTMGRPAALGGGLWATMEVWGAMLAGIAYSALDRKYAALEKVRPLFAEALPHDLEIDTGVARAVAVLILVGLFAARTLVTALAPAAKVAEKQIQAKAASLPAKASALKDKEAMRVKDASENKEKSSPRRSKVAEEVALDTPRTTRSSSRATTPATPGTPGDGLEDTPSKTRKRRSKKKVTAAI